MIAAKNREQILERLLMDHSRLLIQLEEVRRWIAGVSEWGMPRFGELGMQLERFRETLTSHFADEESVENSAVQEMAPEAASRPQSIADLHHQLLARLGTVIECLRAPEPEYCSWQAAVSEAENVMKEIHDHERREISLIQETLAPSQGP